MGLKWRRRRRVPEKPTVSAACSSSTSTHCCACPLTLAPGSWVSCGQGRKEGWLMREWLEFTWPGVATQHPGSEQVSQALREALPAQAWEPKHQPSPGQPHLRLVQQPPAVAVVDPLQEAAAPFGQGHALLRDQRQAGGHHLPLLQRVGGGGAVGGGGWHAGGEQQSGVGAAGAQHHPDQLHTGVHQLRQLRAGFGP